MSHLGNPKGHESLGPDEMHPLILRELVEEVPKPLSIMFEKLWQSCEVPIGWIRGNTASIFQLTGQSVSP